MAQYRVFDPTKDDIRELRAFDEPRLTEQIRYFDSRYDDIKSLMTVEEYNLKQLAKAKQYTQLEAAIPEFTARLGEQLTAPGMELIQSDAFKGASFNQQMGLTRWRLSDAARFGYAAVNALEVAVLLQRNREAGVIKRPPTLKLDENLHNESIGLVAQALSGEQDISQAVSVYEYNQKSMIKDAQADTIQANNRLGRKPVVQGMRVLSGSDHCEFCKSHADYWTIDIDSIKGWHNGCKCNIITRAI